MKFEDLPQHVLDILNIIGITVLESKEFDDHYEIELDTTESFTLETITAICEKPTFAAISHINENTTIVCILKDFLS